jgi:hypothetical protein
MMRIAGASLVTFFVLTYAVMWTCFFTVAAAAIPVRSPLGALLVHLGAYSPHRVFDSLPGGRGDRLRGYALPRLAARFGLARASILLGLTWACWHLPQFFIREADTYGQSFFVYVLQVTALSVAMAWLYARTNGSLLLVMLLHSAVNNSKDIVPSAVSGATNMFGLRAFACSLAHGHVPVDLRRLLPRSNAEVGPAWRRPRTLVPRCPSLSPYAS